MSGEDISPTVTNAILQKHAPELQRNISLNMLVPYLIAAELLTRDEEYTVTNLLLPHGERIMRLLSIIGMKGRNGPSRFLQSIRRSVDDHGAVAAGGHAYLDKLLSGGQSDTQLVQMAARRQCAAGKDVFLSYSREESVKKFVRQLKVDLETEQLSVWLDEEAIPAGTEWPKEIGIALRECKALIPVVTKKYISSQYCKNELYVVHGYMKPIFPIIHEDGWKESDDGEGVNLMIAASNWAMFRPADDYGMSLQRLVEGLKGIARRKELMLLPEGSGKKQQDPMDSLTGQPFSPSGEPHNQTWAESTPPTGLLDEPRPKPAAPTMSCATPDPQYDTSTRKKKCSIDPQCWQFVRLILKLSSILSRDPESDALVLGRMKLSLAILKGQDESTVIDPEVYRGAKTVQEFFEVMSKYWPCYTDHDLLTMVIEATESKEAIDALKCFLQSKDPRTVVPVAKYPDAPFRPACNNSGSSVRSKDRTAVASTGILKGGNGVGDSPQGIEGKHALTSTSDANQQKVCSFSQKKASELLQLSDNLPPDLEPKAALQKSSAALSQSAVMNPIIPADISQQTPADTAQQSGQEDQILEGLSDEAAAARQRSCSTNLVIGQQPQLNAPDPESNEALEGLEHLHHHPSRSHELPPKRVPVVAKVSLSSITYGMYNCLKDVVASVLETPREALCLCGAFKGSCILVWHVSEEIAAGIKRVRLSPDNQEMLLQCAVTKMSCGEECLFSIAEEEFQEMVTSGMIPEFAETVSELEVAEGGEMEAEIRGRVRAITSDEEFQRELRQAGESLVVVDFTADWCYWSLVMDPKFSALSEQYTEAEFLSVDTEECEATAARYEVDAVPMFAFFRKGRLLHQFSGANADKLEARIKHFLVGSGAFFPGKGHSLVPKEDPDTEGGSPGGKRERDGSERQKGGEEQERVPGGEGKGGKEEEGRVSRSSGEQDREGVGKSRVEKEEGRKNEEQLSPITVDPSLPTTSVQIRLADGSRLVGKFNHSHTVRDIHRLISHSRPALAATSYVLITAFPRRELTDDSQTLASANLLNAAIIQKKT